MTYGSTPANQNTGMATPISSMSKSSTASRTTMPAETTSSSRQPTSEIHQNTSRNGLPQYYVYVQQPTSQVCKPGEPPTLRKVKTPHNGKTSVSRFPSAKQDISSQYSSCFEGIGHFPGDPCKFHLKPDNQPARHASKKQGISEEVNEHTDWVHSNIFVEKAWKESHTTHTLQGTLQQNFQTGKEWNMPDISQHTWKCAWMTTSLRLQREPNNSIFKTKPLSPTVQHTAFYTTFYQTLLSAMQNSHQAWKIHQFSQGNSSCKEKRNSWT